MSAMAYVDLNPIRAGMAATPETSTYTSIRARILGKQTNAALTQAIAHLIRNGDLRHFKQPVRPLMGFADRNRTSTEPVLPMHEQDYLQLVDSTGRIAHPNKRGQIDPSIQPILGRVGLSIDAWQEASTTFTQAYRRGTLRFKRSA
jgi:hypothetical protein